VSAAPSCCLQGRREIRGSCDEQLSKEGRKKGQGGGRETASDGRGQGSRLKEQDIGTGRSEKILTSKVKQSEAKESK
jgi:hypothetical protein